MTFSKIQDSVRTLPIEKLAPKLRFNSAAIRDSTYMYIFSIGGSLVQCRVTRFSYTFTIYQHSLHLMTLCGEQKENFPYLSSPLLFCFCDHEICVTHHSD